MDYQLATDQETLQQQYGTSVHNPQPNQIENTVQKTNYKKKYTNRKKMNIF